MLREYTQHDRSQWRWFFVTLTGSTILYLLLLNGYWVRSGDGEVYLGIARNLINQNGYTFNGEPVAILPPLWPQILAAAMKVSTQWWFLKLIPMSCMIGFLGLSYWILLRFTTAKRSAATVLLTALLAQVYPLSIYFFSDAMFALLACAALLLAMQISEGKSPGWRTVTVVLLCAGSIAVRWNGVLWWLMIAAALLQGQTRPRWGRAMMCAIISGIACAATFVGLRMSLRVNPDLLDARYDKFLAGAYSIVNTPQNLRELLDRTALIGGWIGGLLWDLVNDWRMFRPLALIGGWAVVIGCAVVLIDGLRSRTWLWLAAAMQLLVLAFDWPHPMPRYLLPLAPMIILCAWNGFERIGALLGSKKPVLVATKVFIGVFIASIIITNGIQYTMDVWVNRAGDFYRHYEGGVNRSFMAASQFAADQAPVNREVGITYRIRVNGHGRTTAGSMRTFNFLTDRPVVLGPEEICDTDPAENAPLAQWAGEHNVQYFLWQPPIEVWYHFRGTPWAPKLFDEGDFDWRVYELKDGKLQQIPVPSSASELRTVPGLR